MSKSSIACSRPFIPIHCPCKSVSCFPCLDSPKAQIHIQKSRRLAMVKSGRVHLCQSVRLSVLRPESAAGAMNASRSDIIGVRLGSASARISAHHTLIPRRLMRLRPKVCVFYTELFLPLSILPASRTAAIKSSSLPMSQRFSFLQPINSMTASRST